jgi:hypothetical protein
MSENPISPASEGDLISELARETRERREIAVRESVRPRPKFIESVDMSEVLYVGRPPAFPLTLIDVAKLNEALRSQYQLEMADLDLSPLLTKLSRDQLARMDEVELLKRLAREPNAELKWVAGRFPLRDDFVPIRMIEINFESILVSVAGVSQVAEVIAKEVLELMWQIAGTKKRFADLDPLMSLVAYGTGTRLNLDQAPESLLLNPALVQFLDANLAEGSKYAASMGRTRLSVDRATTKISAVASLDDLVLRVSRFDPASGYAEQSSVKFSVTAQNDYGSGRLLVSSTLPYEEHVQFLVELFQAVGVG